MFRSKLTAKRWNVAVWLSKSFIALPSDAPQSFRIVGPLLFAASSRALRAGKVDRGAGVSKGSVAGRRVFAPPPRLPASLPALFHRPPASSHKRAERSGDRR